MYNQIKMECQINICVVDSCYKISHRTLSTTKYTY